MRLSWREMGVGAKKCFNAHGNYPGVQKKDSNVGRRGWVSAGVRARITDQEGQSASLARGLRVLWVTAGKGGVWVKKGGVWAGKGGVWAQSQGNPLGFIYPVPSAGNQGWFVCVLNPNQWVVLDACLSLPLTDSVQNISWARYFSLRLCHVFSRATAFSCLDYCTRLLNCVLALWFTSLKNGDSKNKSDFATSTLKSLLWIPNPQ